MSWKPTASFSHLKLRAEILAKIRQFFEERNILEVETPLLSSATVTDPHIHSFYTAKKKYYLQTSPEFAMKRLLAAGSGAIYQICKAFRDEEQGRQHNPEFTMLEWYRPGFDHHDLMDEMDLFLQTILKTSAAERLSYADAFQQHLNINPHTASLEMLQNCAADLNYSGETDKDTYLQLLISHCIEPHLGKKQPTFLYDFPASQAALSKINQGVAERFEVYINGIELANGYHELTDAREQEKRFLSDLEKRREPVNYDENLLAALTHGLPACAGVAVGVDRLVMLAAATSAISEVLSFPIDRA